MIRHLTPSFRALALLSLFQLGQAVLSAEERPSWFQYFTDAQASGTIVIVDERPGSDGSGVVNPERARQRFSPASTFKIPHALFALEAGAVKDEFQLFPWDGQRHGIEAWNSNQTLRSSMRGSVVWVYERLAHEIGLARALEYLTRSSYGNAVATGKQPYWIEGDLAISAKEQVEFLARLYRNSLPFQIEHQRLVKDLLIIEAGRDFILRAKTGWSGSIGWWVGWVETPSGPVFFALNIDTPKRWEDLPKREAIARAILNEIGALPAPASVTRTSPR